MLVSFKVCFHLIFILNDRYIYKLNNMENSYMKTFIYYYNDRYIMKIEMISHDSDRDFIFCCIKFL
jgi:hypothetical protein